MRDVSGGLAQAIHDSSPSMLLQLLHQTVMEFIEQPDFRQIVLGPLSCITVENCHTVLTKYLLCRDTFLSNYVIAPWRHGTAARPSTRASLG